MRGSLSATTICLLASLVFVNAAVVDKAVAQDTDFVDLTGIWKITYGSVAYYDGRVVNMIDDYHDVFIEVAQQQGAVFFVKTVVTPKDESYPGRHGLEQISGTDWGSVGSIGLDGKTIVIADIGDTSVTRCSLINSDTVECQGWEAGPHAFASTSRLQRVK